MNVCLTGCSGLISKVTGWPITASCFDPLTWFWNIKKKLTFAFFYCLSKIQFYTIIFPSCPNFQEIKPEAHMSHHRSPDHSSEANMSHYCSLHHSYNLSSIKSRFSKKYSIISNKTFGPLKPQTGTFQMNSIGKNSTENQTWNK